MITVVPMATAVTRPLVIVAELSIVAVATVELAHVRFASRVTSWLVPSVKRSVAVKSWVVPIGSGEGAAGVISRAIGTPPETVIADIALMPRNIAVTFAIPRATPTTLPVEETVAVVGAELVQVAWFDTSADVMSENVACARSC